MLTLPAENEKAKELLEHAYSMEVDTFAVDIGILRKYNYYIEVIPVSGDRQTVTYALYTQDFSGEWEEIMEDAEIIWEDNVYR